MAIIEVVLPQLKNDPDSIKAFPDTLPVVAKAFKDANVLRALRGSLITENGKDVSTDHRVVLVLEWPKASAFHAFLESSAFVNMQAVLKPLAKGPSQLNLLETNDGSQLFGTRPVLEILKVQPKNASTDEDVQIILDKVRSSFQKGNESEVVYGSTLNLPQKAIAALRVFEDEAALNAAENVSPRQEFLKEIASLAEVTHLVANVEKFPL
ncbi:hypothetical protein F4779DRAFT_291716 [Xylariaceae sp. FL0662B]|nr:hypothetical protein F4779DRAFT_291716 [Xylariaceae sp. FL0662B]